MVEYESGGALPTLKEWKASLSFERSKQWSRSASIRINIANDALSLRVGAFQARTWDGTRNTELSFQKPSSKHNFSVLSFIRYILLAFTPNNCSFLTLRIQWRPAHDLERPTEQLLCSCNAPASLVRLLDLRLDPRTKERGAQDKYVARFRWSLHCFH
jgi:hypothetical protein